MKIARRNIKKKIKDSKLIPGFIFLAFTLHFLLAHIAFANYLICIENDGRLAIENSIESQFCCNSSIFTQNNYGETEIKDDLECKLCNDISIYENCDEQYSHNIKRINQVSFYHPFIEGSPLNNKEPHNNFLDKYTSNLKTSQIDIYKTVLLLI